MIKKKATECAIHIASVQYLKKLFPHLIFFHTPNGGLRNKQEAQKLNRMGVLSGVPDLLILYSFDNFKAIFIEFKTEKYRNSKNGGLTDAQMSFKEAIEKDYYYKIIYSFDDFVEFINSIFDSKFIKAELTN